MRSRLLLLVVLLALVAAACGSGGDSTPTTADETVPTSQPSAEAALFAYQYAAGDHYDYTFTLDQALHMTVDAEGDETFIGEEAPGDIDITTNVAGTVSYDVAEGPEPDTVQLSISGTFEKLDVSGTVDGEDVAEEMVQDGTVPELIEVPDITIVLDEQGNLVSIDGNEIPDDLPFFGDPFSQLGDFTSGGLSGHFGPAFPDHPLSVGDTWSFEHSEEIEGLTSEISTNTFYEVTGTQTAGDTELFVIEFTTETSEVEVDLGEMFRTMFEAFEDMGAELDDDTTGTTIEIPDLTFTIRVAPTTATGTIWFDQEGGVTHEIQQQTATSIDMLMDISGPDGEGRAEVHMELDMDLSAELDRGDAA